MSSRRLTRLRSSLAATENTNKRLHVPKTRKRKAADRVSGAADQDAYTAQAESSRAPSTPKRRARKKNAVPAGSTSAAPSWTPTVSAVRLMTEAETSKQAGITRIRLADPNASNATLLSPETSRIVTAKSAAAADTSPSKTPLAKTMTSATLLEEANHYLVSVDARMRPLIENNYCRIFSPEGLTEIIDPFESLASGIISQQVSGAAAQAIKARFMALFQAGGAEEKGPLAARRFPHPSQVACETVERLRTAGLSQRKAEYLIGLAQKFAAGELAAQMLADAPYEELLERLTAVRGLGRWSVEMFACFALKRMDVFSLGDLGIQRGMAAFEGRDVAKLKSSGSKWKYMSEREMEEISDRFRPYRSLFMWYMWRVEETDRANRHLRASAVLPSRHHQPK